MKFLIDEDVPVEVVRCLKHRGHSVEVVIETLGTSTPDEEVWRYAIDSQSILLTCNRGDFLRLAGTEPLAGLIILNRRRTREQECAHVLRLLEQAGTTGLTGNINFA